MVGSKKRNYLRFFQKEIKLVFDSRDGIVKTLQVDRGISCHSDPMLVNGLPETSAIEIDQQFSGYSPQWPQYR